MNLYVDQFSSKFDREFLGEVRKTIIIASTPRSGSHMLGHSMIETGSLGVPFEYGNPANLRCWKEMTGADEPADILRAIVRRRTTSNGVFAIKLHFSHLCGIGGLDKCLELFPSPYFVRIFRSDIAKQAVSLLRARQTGIWISGQEGNGGTASYNAGAISRAIREIVTDNAKWDLALRKRNIDPLRLEFDKVAQDVGTSLKAISDFASVPLATVPHVAPTRKQSNDEAGEWLEHYLASTHTVARSTGLLGQVIRFVRSAR